MPIPVKQELIDIYFSGEEKLECIDKMKEASLMQESKMKLLIEERKISKPRSAVS